MFDADAALRDALERSYAAFGSVPTPQKLHASPLRDADEILRTLTSAPLRELTNEQIGPYSGWAMTTVGDERVYRHFVPRILELSATEPTYLGAGPPVIASKLQMAEWENWPDEQQSAVLDFFRAAFNAAITTHPNEGHSADEWLCGLVRLGEPPLVLFQCWRSSRTANAALQMASFIRTEAAHLRKHEQVQRSFWDEVNPKARREVAQLLLSQETDNFLQMAAAGVSEEDQFDFDAALSELQRQH